ncbi:unnamed protein product [Scytosiphon promiscuus]
MDIEEIDDNSSQEARAPPAALTLPITKKRAKPKKDKDSPAAAPSTTLTRFLGPAGPPSLSAWEDVNRQCPVCQQTGFSSRSLALHVNNCIDVGQNVRADASDGESGVATVGNRDNPRASSTRGVRKGGSSDSKASGAGSREGGARNTRREAPSNISNTSRTPEVTQVNCDGEQPVAQATATKRAKTQHGREAVSARAPAAATVTDKSGSTPRSARTQLSSSSQQQQQPTPLRRRALGLARPRGNQAGVDGTPTSAATAATAAAAAAALTRAQRSTDESVRDDMARAQLLYVVEASASSAQQDEGWIGTRLFPGPPAGEKSLEDVCVCCSNQGVCQKSCGAAASGAGRDSRRGVAEGGSGRVRARPASWSAHPISEPRGIWPDSWDVNTSVDDCWGDGDGHLTLRPFPPPEQLGKPGAGPEDDTRGDEFAAAPRHNSGAQSLRSGAQFDSAPTSRAERFLQVFSRLQPARRALNLPESPPSSPALLPRPAGIWGAAARGKDVSADKEVSPNNVVDDGGIMSSSGQKHGPKAKGHGSAVVRPVAKRCAGESIGESPRPLPKRVALGTIAHSSTGNNQLQTSKTVVPSSAKTTSSMVAHSQHPAQECAVALERNPAASRRSPSQPAPSRAQRSVEHPRVHGNEVEARQPMPAAQAQVEKANPARTEHPASDAPASKRNTPGITTAPPTHHSLPSEGIAVATASSSARTVCAAAAAVPPPAQRAVATDGEDAPVGGRCRRNTEGHGSVEMDRPHEPCASPPAALKPPFQSETAEKTGRMRGRLPGATVTVKRGGTSRESCQESSKADVNNSSSGGDRHNRGSMKEPRPSIELAAPVSRQWGGRKACGALGSRASSGLLRSADLEAGEAKQGGEGRREKRPISVNGSSKIASRNASKDAPLGDASQHPASQGREADVADVPQKGSLTVVWEHGATLRSNWSIDNSQVLGKLTCGALLDYDAVWYLSPADADCVGVLRYRVVPHPILAPAGGWISGSGRLRDDPYTIVTATPDDNAFVNDDVEVVSLSSAVLSSSDRSAGASSNRSNPSSSNQRRGNQTTLHRQQSSTRSTDREVPTHGVESGGWHETAEKAAVAPIPRGRNAAQSQGKSDHHGLLVRDCVGPSGKSRNLCSSADLPAAHSSPPQQRPAPKMLPRAAPARGTFALPTSPSAKEIGGNDTGDKVTCPVCQRGMDHWKTGQRQQHVHNCLLKQPNSTKKITTVENPKTKSLTPTRAPGSANRSAWRDSSTARAGRSDQHTTPHESGVRGMGSHGHSAGRDEVLLSDPAESPRSTRVSLQGVFSPKVARGVDATGRGPVHDLCGAPSSRSSATAAVVRKGGVEIRGVLSPGRSTRAGVPHKRNAASGLEECPLCGLAFGGRQGQWEREAHIQQCLESSEGMYDSEG